MTTPDDDLALIQPDLDGVPEDDNAEPLDASISNPAPDELPEVEQ